jgi:glucosamine-6-phosphate deaminase
MDTKLYPNLVFRTVKSEWDVYFDMALAMLGEIRRNNALGKKTVMIVPVGPSEHYPILARLVNELSVSLKNTLFFNMDEYLSDPGHAIGHDHPMSFYGRMQRDFYSQVMPELIMPESQRHFPQPGRESEYDRMLSDLGNADLCVGGLGINGHIAFNEAAENGDPITAEQFGELGTRVLPITRETRTINAYGYQRGDLRGMPEWCITVGMKQILNARSVYIALNREWQHGIARRALFDTVQAQIPATLLRTHPDVRFCATESIAKGLF